MPAAVDRKQCRKEQGSAEEGDSCLQTPGTCESCPNWSKPRFVAVRRAKLVMRGEELICRAASHTMAKRIANALNAWKPNSRGE